MYDLISANVRAVKVQDVESIVALEKMCFEHPYDRLELIADLKSGLRCLVVDNDDMIAGYMTYRMLKSHYDIRSLCVDPHFRRRGYGSSMVQFLIRRLYRDQRQFIYAVVREVNLTAQLFFKANGLVCQTVVRKPFSDSLEDGYLMKYNVDGSHILKQPRFS